MNEPLPVPLSPEQLAAVQAGDGYAHLVDPNTQQIYLLAESAVPTVDEDYVCEKLDEAQASVDRGDIADWSLNEMKNEVRQRIAQNKPALE